MAEFDLRALSLPERHRLLTATVAPRPIALVSTLDVHGRGNLAPFSYWGLGGSNPPSCTICPITDPRRGAKDTLRNIEATGEYVIHVVTRDMAERVNQASFEYPPGVDEFDAVGFTRAPSATVRPPRVAESPLALECRLFSVVRHGDGPSSSNYVIGEVVRVYADDRVLGANGVPDTRKVEPVARLGGIDWAVTRADAHFSLARPTEG